MIGRLAGLWPGRVRLASRHKVSTRVAGRMKPSKTSEAADESEDETICSHDAPDAAAIELLPDALLITVLGFADDPARLAFVVSSKPVATRLKHERDAIVDKLNSTDSSAQLQATSQLYTMLRAFVYASRPVRMIVDAGVVPRLVEFLEIDATEIQREAVGVITTSALSDSVFVDVLVEAGGVPILCRLLRSPDKQFRRQVPWALVQVLSDSPYDHDARPRRDLMLEHGAFESVLQTLHESSKIQHVLGCVRLLARLCHPQLELERSRPAIAAFAKFIEFPDDRVRLFACQGLAFVSDCGSERAQAVIDTGACPRLIELLSHPSLEITTCAIFIVGNLCSTDDDHQSQLMVDLSVLPRLLALLDQPNKDMCREALWTIGNLCAGPFEHIQAVFGVDDLVTRVIELLGASNLRIRREAVTVVHNITRNTGPGRQSVLVNLGCIPLLCKLLKLEAVFDDFAVQDDAQSTAIYALISLRNIIDATGVFRECISETVLETIKSLQHHEDENLSTAAGELFDALAPRLVRTDYVRS